MEGRIIKILPVKYSQNGDTVYTRVSFRLTDGSFCQTDLCHTYGNYRKWLPFLKVGIDLSGLEYYSINGKINKKKICADKSNPQECQRADFEIIDEWTRPLVPLQPKIYQAKLI